MKGDPKCPLCKVGYPLKEIRCAYVFVDGVLKMVYSRKRIVAKG